MTGEQLGYIMELLMSEGALDTFFTTIMMKKNRPGVKLAVICKDDDRQRLTQVILKNTSTFGVRYIYMQRDILQRKIVPIMTRWGEIRLKLGILDQEIIKCSPEYEDCKKYAKEYNIPINDIYNEVIMEYRCRKNVADNISEGNELI